MRDRNWGVPAILLSYVGVLSVLALVMAYGFARATRASEESTRRTEQEKTVLNQRLESAREIRQALARPVPPPDPLPPINAKLANPEKVANVEQPKIAARRKPSTEHSPRLKMPGAAWNAMAMGTGAEFPSRPINASFDRAGQNGW